MGVDVAKIPSFEQHVSSWDLALFFFLVQEVQAGRLVFKLAGHLFSSVFRECAQAFNGYHLG